MTDSMNNIAQITTYRAFSDLKWDDTSYSELEKYMQQAINEDPLLAHPDLISVALEGNSSDRIFTLIGKVQNEKEKQRAEEIVKNNAGEYASVKNNLTIA